MSNFAVGFWFRIQLAYLIILIKTGCNKSLLSATKDDGFFTLGNWFGIFYLDAYSIYLVLWSYKKNRTYNMFNLYTWLVTTEEYSVRELSIMRWAWGLFFYSVVKVPNAFYLPNAIPSIAFSIRLLFPHKNAPYHHYEVRKSFWELLPLFNSRYLGQKWRQNLRNSSKSLKIWKKLAQQWLLLSLRREASLSPSCTLSRLRLHLHLHLQHQLGHHPCIQLLESVAAIVALVQEPDGTSGQLPTRPLWLRQVFHPLALSAFSLHHLLNLGGAKWWLWQGRTSPPSPPSMWTALPHLPHHHHHHHQHHHHHVPPHCDLHCATTTVDITARIVEDVTISASTTMAATA